MFTLSKSNNQKAMAGISSGDVNFAISRIFPRDCGFNGALTNRTFQFRATSPKGNIRKPSLFSKKIMKAANSSKEVEVLPFIKVRPMNQLLAEPLEPIQDSVKEQNSEVIKITVESKSKKSSTENNQINNLNREVKPKSKDSNSLERGKQTTDNQLSLSEDEILLEDSDVLRMDLCQKLDKRLQFKENLSNNCIKQIFIGNIPSSMKQLHISKFFERYGKISHLKFIRSKSHKTVICFITYDTVAATRAALETNGLFYLGCNLRVSRVGRGRVLVYNTIVVTKLPEGTTIQDLYNVFESCGLIKSQYLVRESKKLVAYITFELTISVRYALRLNNFLVRGSRVLVDQYKNQRENQRLSNFIS